MLDAAIKELEDIVGKSFLLIDIKSREMYSRSTLSTGTVPSAIVKPRTREEIESILKIASAHGLKVHTISTGKNWGYSDACAPNDGNLILDLSRMNSIIEVNEELCYATIEPGVTQGQLYEYLEHNHVNVWMDATGAGPDTSIIGNIMERGFGHSPHGDRYAHSCAYEVVLPTGEVLHTGFGHYENSKVSEVYKWGVGPSIDGLFTQSNLGVVTKMTIWLLPKPEDFKVLFFVLKEENDIIAFIENIRSLKIDGTLKSVVHISNDLRTISTLQRFPFDEVASGSYLSKEKRRELRDRHGVGFWTGTAGFYGSKEQNKADLLKVMKKLKNVEGVRHLLIMDEFRLFLFEKYVYVMRRFGFSKNSMHLSRKVKMAFDLLKGKTPPSSLLGGLWRIKKDSHGSEGGKKDLYEYGSGFYWISPILPMRGDDIHTLTVLVEPIFNTYNFDLLQTISMVSDRSVCAVMTICFDARNKEESERAKKCHDDVVAVLIKNGYILYRAGNHSMKFLEGDSQNFFNFLKRIKKAIDPQNILSPGKYIPE